MYDWEACTRLEAWRPRVVGWWAGGPGYERFPMEVLSVEDRGYVVWVEARHDHPLIWRLLGMLLFCSPRRLVIRRPSYQFSPRLREES